MTQHDHQEDQLWRTIGLAATVGLAAYGVYKLMSDPTMRERARAGIDRVKETAQSGYERAKDSAQRMGGKVKEQASRVGKSLSGAGDEVASAAGDEIADLRSERL